jgi:hypothetical protein
MISVKMGRHESVKWLKDAKLDDLEDMLFGQDK